MYSPQPFGPFIEGQPIQAPAMESGIADFQMPIANLLLLRPCFQQVSTSDCRNHNWQSEIGSRQWSYLFENWKRLRAPFCPYFFRSLIRGSRVTKPACLRAGRRSALNSISARVIPCRIAPAWPDGPPPATLTTMSNL